MTALLGIAIGCCLAQTPAANDPPSVASSLADNASAPAPTAADERSAWAFLYSPFVLGLAGSLVGMAIPLTVAAVALALQGQSTGYSQSQLSSSPLLVWGSGAASALGLVGAMAPHIAAALNSGRNPFKVLQRGAPALAVAFVGISLLACTAISGLGYVEYLASVNRLIQTVPGTSVLGGALFAVGGAIAIVFTTGAPMAGPIGALLVTPLQDEWL